MYLCTCTSLSMYAFKHDEFTDVVSSPISTYFVTVFDLGFQSGAIRGP